MEREPLFKFDTERRDQLRLARESSFSIAETVVQERRLMRVFSIIDPGWKPFYRGMPLEHKEAIGTWCGIDQPVRRSLVHGCLIHGILWAHPKKFARVLHARSDFQGV